MTTNLKIIALLEKCDKTLGLLNQIIQILNATDEGDLKNVVEELHKELGDGTLNEAQAEIRDMILDLRWEPTLNKKKQS